MTETSRQKPMRIASLVPSATEIVCALGLVDELVAVSHDCDWPPEIRRRSALSTVAVDAENGSAAIDRAVRDRVHGGRSLYHIDRGRLEEIAPDLIFTQELCEVCAPSFDRVEEAARVVDAETRVVSLEPSTLDEILETVRIVGRETGAEIRASELMANLERRIEAVRRRADDVDAHPRVACLDWLDPLFAAGHWIPEMVEIVGGRPLGARGEPSRKIGWDQLADFAPEVLVLMPCGFTPERTRGEMEVLTRRKEWGRLPAVAADRVHVVHAGHHFSRPGPRMITGLEILLEVVHPELSSSSSPSRSAAGTEVLSGSSQSRRR